MTRFAAFILFAAAVLADTGVLIPGGREEPDPAILALNEMAIDIWIEDQHARVLIRQIFGNRTASVQEGKWSFALPGRALVSDFAVWDGPVRIPGVILERRRAEEIYESLRRMSIDPGILENNERSFEQAKISSLFSARIVPIPPRGTKRVELEYREPLAIEKLKTRLTIPLRPELYRTQNAGRVWITVHVDSAAPIRDLTFPAKSFPMRVTEQTPNRLRASIERENVSLTEDFAIEFSYDAGAAGLRPKFHRPPGEAGYFLAPAITAPDLPASLDKPVEAIVLMDTSLSMQWDKLDRAWLALERLLRSMNAASRFHLLLFGRDVRPFESAASPVSTEAIERALAFVKGESLQGGTDMQAALRAGLDRAASPDACLILLTDGGSNTGLVATRTIASWYDAEWKKLDAARRPRTYVLGVGDDANQVLLASLAEHAGVFEWIRSAEDPGFKLDAFLSKIGRDPLQGLTLATTPLNLFSLVYPLHDAVFPGSLAAWTGRYATGGAASLRMDATFGTRPVQWEWRGTMPDAEPNHAEVARIWAKARVDALLRKINTEGEDTASIDEIIRLSRKYKFVTPYTSFLAAPRALMLSSVVQPGDPVVRVRTDPAVISVVALLPFGGTQPLRYYEREKVWQTRFLAPPDVTDGAYPVRLILRGRDGRCYRETKKLTILSKPPALRVRLAKREFRRGETVRIRAHASETARTISARVYGSMPGVLRWNPVERASTGELRIATDIPPGPYRITVTAEDFAHNQTSVEAPIAVLP